jgi:hypothetical protein
MNRSLVIALVSLGFAAGCLISWLSPVLVPPARAGTTPQRWEYQCDNDVRGFNRLGREGWEMAAGGGVAGTFCFKRPL